MPNYDMSQTACLERAEQTKKLDDTISKKEFGELVKAIAALHKMVNINHQIIQEQQKEIKLLKEMIKCSKQDC